MAALVQVVVVMSRWWVWCPGGGCGDCGGCDGRGGGGGCVVASTGPSSLHWEARAAQLM